ncbi:MAG: hypothetical protein QXP65_04955 [Candidatus Hadarchaeales archaeon]
MSKVRVELFIAWPPTSLCGKLVELAKRVVSELGEQVELVIYQRGQPYPIQPTTGFMRARKTVKLPAVFVDGELLAERELPSEEKLRSEIKKRLEK